MTKGWSARRVAKTALFGFLAVYTVALLYAEWRFSQDYVHTFFTDIKGSTRLYAVNTTISMFLLWANALVFGISLVCIQGESERGKQRLFYSSQVFLFTYLGCDERFRLHELLGGTLGFEDAFILLAFGMAEIGLILFLGELKTWPRRVTNYLYLGAVLFAVMIFVDAFLPQALIFRLSCEDLSKTWADVFLFLFAWEICVNHIALLKRRAGGTPSDA